MISRAIEPVIAAATRRLRTNSGRQEVEASRPCYIILSRLNNADLFAANDTWLEPNMIARRDSASAFSSHSASGCEFASTWTVANVHAQQRKIVQRVALQFLNLLFMFGGLEFGLQKILFANSSWNLGAARPQSQMFAYLAGRKVVSLFKWHAARRFASHFRPFNQADTRLSGADQIMANPRPSTRKIGELFIAPTVRARLACSRTQSGDVADGQTASSLAQNILPLSHDRYMKPTRAGSQKDERELANIK